MLICREAEKSLVFVLQYIIFLGLKEFLPLDRIVMARRGGGSLDDVALEFECACLLFKLLRWFIKERIGRGSHDMTE